MIDYIGTEHPKNPGTPVAALNWYLTRSNRHTLADGWTRRDRDAHNVDFVRGTSVVHTNDVVFGWHVSSVDCA